MPARDAAATIGRLLDGLARQDIDQPYEVIVVDDGSVDETATIAERAEVRVIRRRRGDGAGAARNEGARSAAGDKLVFLDADCAPAPQWLRTGVPCLESADLVQGRVEPEPGVPVGPFDHTLHVMRPSGLFEAANLFVSRRLFESVGGFEAGLEQDGERPFGEDVLFGWRARRVGARTSFCRAAIVYHAVFPRSAADFIRERRRYALFPALVREAPELRAAFLYRRGFLNARTARLALACASVAIATGTRSAAPLAGTFPYARLVARDARADHAVAAVRVLADAVGELALMRGSVAARRVVL